MLLCSAFPAEAQEVEHNYLVGPQFTQCDSLEIEGMPLEEAIEKIRETKFRYQQNFILTRRHGFKGGEYYSCNNTEGYLIVLYHDNTVVYQNVKKEFWEKLISSTDPEGVYLSNRKSFDVLR
jgi:hypothetical protein